MFQSPFDQPSYKKAKKKKKKAPSRKKKAPARKSAASIIAPPSTKKCSRTRTSPARPGGDYCNSRSPGGVPDPKVDEAMLAAAFSHVGVPKTKQTATLSRDGKSLSLKTARGYGYPGGAAYLTVAYGGGVDSTAILVGLDQLWRETRNQKWVPVAITFSDTGGEHPHTYEFIVKWLEPWLKKKAFRGARNRPTSVTKVCYSTLHGSRGWGTGYTLETQNLINHSLPSISMGGHTCSTKYKIDAQSQWTKSAIANREIPNPGKKKIIRAIGYDATEVQRITSKSGTYVSQHEQSSRQKAWYPLVEWGWDRARCIAESKVAIGRAPSKSSCWFCGAMRPNEILLLAKYYPKLLDRAIFMEQVAKHGRNRPHGGLNMGGWLWTDFVLGDLKALDPWPSAMVYIVGGVVRQHPTKISVPRQHLGQPRPAVLEENETYIEGTGAVYTKARVDRIVKLAKEWIAASPDHGHRVPGWRTLRRGEKPGRRRTRERKVGSKIKTEVATTVADPAYKGMLENDMALNSMTRKIPAFTHMLGFRCTPEVFAWNTLEDKHLIGAQVTGHEVNAKKIRKILGVGCKSRAAANPPGGRRLPVVVYESPMLTGF